MLNDRFRVLLRNAIADAELTTSEGPVPVYGDAILLGNPGTWDEYIGQDLAKHRLQAAVAASVTLPRRATASKLRKLAMGGKSDMKALPYLRWIYSGNLTICQ